MTFSDAGLLFEPPSPTPTYDPLATPALPPNPSNIELGEYHYYYHCMPCHGDVGQGLTDAFRQVWEEDHQNCWGRGCHGGRPKDEGFPIPTFVPMVISKNDALRSFQTYDQLLSYLVQTHPPQYPGKLEDREYQSMTAFLWASNNKPTASSTASPSNTPRATATLSETPIPTQAASTSTQPALTVAPEPIAPAGSGPQGEMVWFLLVLVLILLLFLIFRGVRKKV